jgi:signal transduction histidine kinase
MTTLASSRTPRVFFKWLAGLLAVAILTTMLVFLTVKSRNTAPQARADLVAELLRLREINARLDVDILRSRSGLNSDYDPLQDGLLATQKVRAQLEANLAHADIRSPDEMAELLQTFEQKFAIIEDFKATNAIRLNSLRYLPILVDGIANAPEADEALRFRASEIAAALFRHALIGDTNADAPRQTLTALTPWLQDLAPETEFAQSIQGLRIHAEIILRQNEHESELLAALAAIPVVKRIDILQDNLEGIFADQAETAERYRSLLTVYSGFLLLLILYIGARLVFAYRQLAQINDTLNKTNEYLEQRVEERTHDLNTALSELKASEVHLIQSEKMASLGQMVAGVAHEINTPLGYVRGTVEHIAYVLAEVLEPYCRAHMETPGETENDGIPPAASAAPAPLDAELFPELRTALDNSLYGLDQISEIVLNLKNFSRLDRGQHTLYRLEEGIDNALMLAKNLVKHRKVVKHYGVNTRPVACAPSQINQVMLNLITNAVQATSDGDGTITITTRMKGDDTVVVKIADNGTGIPEDVLGRIFDPFFTTKEIGKGTGLGLSIVYKIIEQHRGKIQVFSKPDLGALFSIELPVDGGAAGEKNAAPSASPEEALLLED